MKLAAFSDQHGQTNFDIPQCDLLLVAGDICPDSVHQVWTRNVPTLCIDWIRDVWLPWVQPYVDDGWVRQVCFTWGNHDWTQGLTPLFHKILPPEFHLLVDEGVVIDGVNIYGTPWCNPFMKWAWMREKDRLVETYAQIPQDTHILISHQPPWGCGDEAVSFDPGPDLGAIIHVGSKELSKRLLTVQPKAVVCGHIHGGYGRYSVGDTYVYNVSVVNERYRVVNPVTEFEV